MKLKYIYAAGVLLLMSGCGGNSKSGEDSASLDSTATEEGTEIAVAPEITDLVCLDAHGDIERLVETVKENLYESSSTFLFNEAGELVAINGEEVGMERDEQKRPTKLTMEVTDEMGETQPTYVSFLYDDNNRLTTENHEDYDASWTVVYTRDENGRQTGMTISDPTGGNEVYTFEYPENAFDEHGNWTERTQKNGETTAKITRQITYRVR